MDGVVPLTRADPALPWYIVIYPARRLYSVGHGTRHRPSRRDERPGGIQPHYLVNMQRLW